MASSTQDFIQAGAVVQVYKAATGGVVAGTIVNHDGAAATVSTATSLAGYGIAANDADAGEDVFVVLAGRARLKFGGTVTAGAYIVATTAGAGLAAGTSVRSKIRCIPDQLAGAGYVSGDIGFVFIGNDTTTPA
jgi:hypothetical protein